MSQNRAFLARLLASLKSQLDAETFKDLCLRAGLGDKDKLSRLMSLAELLNVYPLFGE